MESRARIMFKRTLMKVFAIALFLGLSRLLGISQDKPNIVLLLVDDLGWADVGYRNGILQTPNIDRLKKDALDFTRAYIATPTCSPSRASLLTGKEPVRMQLVRHIPKGKKGKLRGEPGDDFNILDTDPAQMRSRNFLPLEEVTYAERLREFGYYNSFIGKWHLGNEKHHPIHQGFHEQYGTANAGHPRDYYAPFFHEQKNVLAGFSKNDYLTDVLTKKAEEFIGEYGKSQPFMLTLWYYSVHNPHIGRQDWVQKYQGEGLPGKYAHYAAMVSAMDESVGRIRKALEEKGISENTVIIYMSDQGGDFSNAPLTGAKNGGNALGEGGARVPLLIHYPGVTSPNSTCHTPVQSIDIFPTLVEIASGKERKDESINGVSLLPLIKGQKLPNRNLYFFRSYEDQYAAIVSGNWKYIKYHSGQDKLFNLMIDIGEQKNLITEFPGKARELGENLQNWVKEAVPN